MISVLILLTVVLYALDSAADVFVVIVLPKIMSTNKMTVLYYVL